VFGHGTVRYILANMGIFVFNYIDNLIGIAPDEVANKHFSATINLLKKMGLVLSSSKTVPLTYLATCLGINFNILQDILQIPGQKLQEIVSMCNHHLHQKFITKNKLQALTGY
jgi:hypothetical protein